MPNTIPIIGFHRHIPNIITLLRLLITPLAYFFITHSFFGYAFLCFALAGISDGVDGYLARKWNVISKFGRIFDPIADKALMFVTFITLGIAGKLPIWLVTLVISRDALIILSGFFTFLFKFPIHFSPVWSSKINTFFQIILVGTVLVGQTDFYSMIVPEFARNHLINLLVWITTLTTIWSGTEYGLYFVKQLYRLHMRGKNA